jgi:histone arginine demethylase JMJD6
MKNIAAFLEATTAVANDDIDLLTKKYFNDNYGYPARPVNFTKAFRNWEIKSKWSEEYLSQVLQEPVVMDSVVEAAPIALTLEQYMAGPTAGLYYKTGRHLSTALRQDFASPSPFNCWYANTGLHTPKTKLSWLYAGHTGTGSQLHRDIWWTSAWNYLISGKKLWLVYPAAYTRQIAQSLPDYRLTLENVDMMSYLALRYKPMTCIQQPGDMVFVPGDCYHLVLNLEKSISLTENFINETNYDLVKGYFRLGNSQKNYEDIEAVVAEGFNSLKLVTA